MQDSPTVNIDESDNSHSLSSKDRAVAIGVSVVGGIALITLIALLIPWWRRRRSSKTYNHTGVNSAAESSQMEDPNSSGWADGTWAKSNEPVHPSLIPPPGVRIPRRDGSGSASSLTPGHWPQTGANHSTTAGGANAVPPRDTNAIPLSPLRSAPIKASDPMVPSVQGSSTWHGHEPTSDDENTVIVRGPIHPFALATPSSPSYANTPRTPLTPPSVSSPTPSSRASTRSNTPLIAKFHQNRRAVVLARNRSVITSIPENASRTEDTSVTDRAPHRSIFLEVEEESRPPSYDAKVT